ncbi:DUF4249 domain-containing protein [Algoriphagus sp. A40]|uniref:DUF4249 domain-containing protein n=1 Tax=Algoriphagus sp. A40 TaxID=1945863 RepID=UPI00098654CE|nr:DUF4249 domain-containing protein [Algoriphagus sp. A40]OOG78416.1 hypothetical protein B0E43_01775 [Algoriphagus sp. A40]
MRSYFFVVGGFFMMLQGCRELYNPEVFAENLGILVVEGYLDTEGNPSQLKISRTVPLSYDSIASPESGALVALSSDSGESFQLQEISPGLYQFEKDIDEESRYRLEIVLSNGDRYESLELKPIRTPEILEAGFVKDEDGVEIFVNTQGNEQADDFLWTYDETWIFRPYTQVGYIFDPMINDVRDRKEVEQIYTCYKTEPNPGILLESSSRFQDQVVFRQTITEIPTGNERLQARYSILISQMAIPSDAVAFWETLKRNTEDIGSIFSPLPSLISGNIVSVDGDKQVVGQVNLGVVRQHRLYIDREEISPWPYSNEIFFGCVVGPEPILIGTIEIFQYFGSGAYLPAQAFMGDGPVPAPGILGYYPTEVRCGDCTLYADITKPDFWEDE